MGQKVNPHGIRVGVIKDWDSKWYAEDEFEIFLLKIMRFVSTLKRSYTAQEFPRSRSKELLTE